VDKLKTPEKVCLLLGPDSERDEIASYLERAGYKAFAFKNPAVFFESVQIERPAVVVLETSALKTKLSEWVKELHSRAPETSWITLAPMNQWSILSSYNNRGLVEIVSSEPTCLKERLVWALNRESAKAQLKRVRELDFVETPETSASSLANGTISTVGRAFDLGTLIEIRFQDAKTRKRPFLLGVLTLDDPQEIETFWGVETLRQVQELLENKIREFWGAQNHVSHENSNYILINSIAANFLTEVRNLQFELQEQGRLQFGFRISISGGLSEAFVHARTSEDMRRLAFEACRHMASRGGGRVGIPRPIQGGLGGNVPQDLG